MIKHSIQKTQQILQEQWLTFFEQFTKSNNGRLIALEVVDKELGDELLVKESPLASITYEPKTKGKDVIITIDRDAAAYSHTITTPKAVWVAKDDSDKIVALEIVAHSGNQAILNFSQ